MMANLISSSSFRPTVDSSDIFSLTAHRYTSIVPPSIDILNNSWSNMNLQFHPFPSYNFSRISHAAFGAVDSMMCSFSAADKATSGKLTLEFRYEKGRKRRKSQKYRFE